MKIQKSLRLSNNLSGLMNKLVNEQEVQLKKLLESGLLDEAVKRLENDITFKALTPFLSYSTQASYSSVLRAAYNKFSADFDKISDDEKKNKANKLILHIPQLEKAMESKYKPVLKNFTVQFSLEESVWNAIERLCYSLKDENSRNLRLSFIVKMIVLYYAESNNVI